jgi:hypothetical protein
VKKCLVTSFKIFTMDLYTQNLFCQKHFCTVSWINCLYTGREHFQALFTSGFPTGAREDKIWCIDVIKSHKDEDQDYNRDVSKSQFSFL